MARCHRFAAVGTRIVVAACGATASVNSPAHHGRSVLPRRVDVGDGAAVATESPNRRR